MAGLYRFGVGFGGGGGGGGGVPLSSSRAETGFVSNGMVFSWSATPLPTLTQSSSRIINLRPVLLAQVEWTGGGGGGGGGAGSASHRLGERNGYLPPVSDVGVHLCMYIYLTASFNWHSFLCTLYGKL